MAFSFETLGRDWGVSITDLLLAVAAFLAANHAAGKNLNLSDFSTETNLVGIAFLTLSLCAFLGFVRWGFLPNNKVLNRVYGNLIELTKHASIPFLLLNLVTQNYATKGQIFVGLHILWAVTNLLIQLDSAQNANISQVLTVGPLIVLLIQAILKASFFLGIVVGAFLMVPIVMKQNGVPAFHVLLSLICWLLESARVESYAQFKIPVY